MERRRTPDSELLPEDSEHSGPGADLPRRGPAAAAPPPRPEWRIAEPEAPRVVIQESPAIAPRAEEPAAVSRVEEPAPVSGSFMGFSLGDSATSATHVEVREEPAKGLSGPSFLGLGDGASSNPDYLLEDEPRRHSARNWFLVILLLLGALGYGQWRANGQGKTLFAGLPSIRAPKPVLANVKQPLNSSSADDDDSPDIAVEPTNQDLKAQQAAAQQADGAKKTDAAQKTDASPKPDAAQQKDVAPAQAAAQKEQASDDWKPLAKPEGLKSAEAAAADKSPAARQDEAAAVPAKAKDKPAAARVEKTKARIEKGRSEPVDNSASTLAEGQRYLYGQGGRKSCDRALNLIHSAASQGNAEARAQLGGMYATGNCAPFDRVMAYRWFTLALNASPKSATVARTRDMLWREMTDTERQRAKSAAD